MSTRGASCQIELKGDAAVITPTRSLGELVYQQFVSDVGFVWERLGSGHLRHLVLDWRNTDYFGSEAIGQLLKLRTAVRNNHGQMVFCGLSRHEREILQLMRLDGFWPTYESRDEALNALHCHTTKVLVVDDSEVARRLAGGLLQRQPHFEIAYATNGKDALERMKEQAFDLVVTDLIMPEMDGLNLIRSIRNDFPSTPVILLTAYGNEALAAHALEAGAASYVPKSQQAERLLETAQRVLALSGDHLAQKPLQQCQIKVDGSFVLENDSSLIPPVIGYIQQTLASFGLGDRNERIRIGVALEEALLNGLYHGNLEIGSAELSQARIRANKYGIKSLVERRCKEARYRGRKLVLDFHITSHTARFVVFDGGAGFDTSSTTGVSSKNRFECGHHRGLTLMHNFMDEVIYNDVGNEVTLIKIPEKAV